MEKLTINDESTAKHIWHDILQNSMKPFGWKFEFNSVSTIPNGTSFKVNANYVVGMIKIQQKENNAFDVTITPDNFGDLLYEDVTAEDLVSVIDRVLTQGIFADNRESTEYRIAV